ncbi:MAG: ester cyclase [Saprospiraceae bacterium]
MKQIKFFNLTLLLAFVATSLFANNHYPTPTDIVKAYFAAVDAGNADETAKVLADDCWASAPFLSQPVPKQGWIGVVQSLKGAFPNMKHEVVDCIESGYKVAVRGMATGQNSGSFMGNPPTGNRINFPFNTIFELDKSWKIKAIYVQFDQKTMEAQLMAGLPDPAAAAEATVRGIMAAADAGDGEKLIAYFAPDAKHYFSGQPNTNDELKKRVAAFKIGFPDIKRTMEEVIVNGNVITLRGSLTGTNTGAFMGAPATNNKIKVSVLGVYKLNSAGKVTEAWVEMDRATIQMQLKDGIANSGK